MLLLMGIFGFALIFNAHLNLNLAVNAAARTASAIDFSRYPGEQSYDQPIYDELVGSFVLLSKQNIVDITIYRPLADGSVDPTMKNVLDKNGNLIGQATYPNSLRTMDTQIAVQVRYNQPVIVPLISAITGEQVQIVKRAAFRLE